MRYILSFSGILIIFSFFSQQKIVIESQLTLKENKFYQKDQLYSGQVICLFENGQIKSMIEIKDGLPNGKTIEFLFDKSFQKTNYKDSVEIRKCHTLMSEKKAEIEINIQDTLIASKELKDFINYEIGGDDKLVKLKEKNDEGKLNKKKKEDFDKYESLVQIKNKSIRKLVDSEKDMNEISNKLKTELNKKEYIPIKLKEYTIANSIKEGLAIIYDSLGNKFGEGNYKNGKQDGKWIYYFSNGKKSGEGLYVNGDESTKGKTGVPKNGREGVWRFYFENGKISDETLYSGGKRNGLSKLFSDIGNTSEEANYKYDILDGRRIFYHPNGKIHQDFNYKDGILEGQSKIYFSDGQLKESGTYLNGKASGHFVFYNENGSVKSEVDYKDGKKMGLEVVYNIEGKKIKEYNLTNDVKNGVEKEYYDDGKLKAERNFKMGMRHGKVKTYYESGKIEAEGNFENDKAHGGLTTYFENGKIELKATIDTTSLAQNNMIGDVYWYNEDGTLKNQGYAHKDGRLEDKTVSNSNSTSGVSNELKKPYKCKCCKSTINGLIEGVDKDGREYNDLFVQLIGGKGSDTDTFYRKLGYDGIYDYMRKDTYKFCTMKCARTCYE
jgi:antitoxin component YwqK of YwqJK toxin-antitoxin module